MSSEAMAWAGLIAGRWELADIGLETDPSRNSG